MEDKNRNNVITGDFGKKKNTEESQSDRKRIAIQNKAKEIGDCIMASEKIGKIPDDVALKVEALWKDFDDEKLIEIANNSKKEDWLEFPDYYLLLVSKLLEISRSIR